MRWRGFLFFAPRLTSCPPLDSMDKRHTGGTLDNQTQFNDKFCFACGKGLIRSAVVCPGCGTPAVVSIDEPRRASGPAVAQRRQSPSSRSKTTAVLLAIFLSYFTYLYTYEDHASKFWLHFAMHLTFTAALLAQWPLWVLVIGLLYVVIVWISSIFEAAIAPTEFYKRHPVLKT